MNFDVWIHLLEFIIVLGIGLVVWYTKRNNPGGES